MSSKSKTQIEIGTKVTAFQNDGTPYVIGALTASEINPVSGKTLHHIKRDCDPDDAKPFITPAQIAPWNGEEIPACTITHRYEGITHRAIPVDEVRSHQRFFDRVLINRVPVSDEPTAEEIAKLQKLTAPERRYVQHDAPAPTPERQPEKTLQELIGEVNDAANIIN